MSYYMLSGLSALSGFGGTRLSERPPFALYGYGASLALYGFGQISFNSGTVWSDWLAGASGNNAAGARAAKAIQAALNQLGYGPVTVDGQFGGGSKTAFAQFASDNGIALQQTGWPNQVSVIKMGELVSAGTPTGPAAPIAQHEVGGQIIPGAAPPRVVGGAPVPAGGGAAPTAAGVSKAGLTTTQMLGIGALALVAIGVLALAAKKKKGAPAHAPAHPAHHPAHHEDITITETIPRRGGHKPIRETIHVR